jgi:rRNA maturation endonuclease Nob1
MAAKQYVHFCSECEIEFHVKHDADERSYPVLFCPFCGIQVDDEHYDIEDENEDEE